MNASGSAEYQAALEEMYTEDPDVGKAFDLLSQAVDASDPLACYALATWFIHGQEPWVVQDHAAAIPLLEIAVRAGNPSAAFDLAISLEKGAGIAVDLPRAFDLYQKAAAEGHAKAVHEVGRCYYFGIGVAEDRACAETWYDRAEALGITEEDESPEENDSP